MKNYSYVSYQNNLSSDLGNESRRFDVKLHSSTQEQDDEFEPEGPPETDGIQGLDESAPSQELSDPTNAVAPMTGVNTKEMIEEPYYLNIGRHFEHTISDVHEAVRRHTNPILDGNFTVMGTDISTEFEYRRIFVECPSMLKSYYAAWCGTVRHRYFYSGTDVPVEISKFSSSLDDDNYSAAIDGYALTTAKLSTGTSINVSVESGVSYAPREIAFPLANNTAMIDVSVPFDVHLNFLATMDPTTSGMALPSRWAALYHRVPTSTNIRGYESAGDDFRFGIFRPPLESYIRPYKNNVTTAIATPYFNGLDQVLARAP